MLYRGIGFTSSSGKVPPLGSRVMIGEARRGSGPGKVTINRLGMCTLSMIITVTHSQVFLITIHHSSDSFFPKAFDKITSTKKGSTKREKQKRINVFSPTSSASPHVPSVLSVSQPNSSFASLSLSSPS